MSTNSTIEFNLNNFTKNNDNKSVVLNWSSTNESNFNKFIIEKSNNTIDFNPIGEVKTINNNSITKNYNYIDSNPFIGKNYYRLKMVDNDNSTKLSNISVVNILNQNLKLEKIKPNPFENQLSIDFNIPNNDQIVLEIIDITGKKIIQNQYDVISGDNNIQLNTNDLNKGLYILKISNSNITLKSKIIKN
ncbi:MAG: T9SS type A sorting domain-containing protein [Saprospiraceae bacterium]|nr:T9SS type A sorting domain-containing protein [Saprospiraceae bacterium]